MPWPGFFSSCDDTACKPVNPHAPSPLSLAFSVGHFLVTFAVLATLAHRHLFPRLAAVHESHDGHDNLLPPHAPATLRQAHAEHGRKTLRRRAAALAFSATVALAAVLAELILCEVAGLVHPRARALGLAVVIPALLVLLVGVVPFLEIQSVVSGLGYRFQRTAKGNMPRLPWAVQLVAFAGWLALFWSLGLLVPRDTEPHAVAAAAARRRRSYWGGLAASKPVEEEEWEETGLTRACLERIGVVGILLMAMLSGFAAVSSPWHTLLSAAERKKRPITEADVARKEAGLDAAGEMLLTKRRRLQALERKSSTTRSRPAASSAGGGGGGGLVGKMLGAVRGVMSGDEAEMRALRVEIAGLETMQANLGAQLGVMRSKQAATARAGTRLGRCLAVPRWLFSFYCVYRVAATALTTVRRAYGYGYHPSSSPAFSSSDPISRFLGLLARHWDPQLDQTAWARQISFLLSGVMLAASANSATQTFHLFSRWAPGLRYQAQANLALLTGQVAAVYVVSAALLLRSSLPREVGWAVGDALRSALDPWFVDRWFEGWFLVSSVATAVGIFIGRKMAVGGGDDWDDLAGEEMGQKRC
ncbi:hypothetical protein SODALDRAFT_333079 [Sodiomyces alkalinus F11]|uniref:Abscisic acid G-protein coupled receptor-like domain-containing protein n=1 Tax=Sodiomyces alkalinus (strain CBS 110278 / VKM F-3762 / F11) TaxID=1314773 RepID=A0A3N2PVF9_SODAK|nr:hypothetical protein SODALDRAFT_333079 [Sodiomyces alkalinus F11]ROT38485.1 hypothetical protein SODALDRAFT_333079 [Sodiomyces alkalinus F11]